MRIWINQWLVGVKGEVKYLFTPNSSGYYEVLAIAKATFGDIEWLQDQDAVRMEFTDAEIDGVREVFAE